MNYCIIAHRGAPHLAVENTLSAFQAAIDLGAKYIELDVHLTKDQRLAVHHDQKLGRTVKAKGLIADYTLAELQQFAIPPLPKGAKIEHIPSLEQVIALCRGKCHLAVEAKCDVTQSKIFAQALHATLTQCAQPSDVTVISFCHPLLKIFSKLNKQFSWGASFDSRPAKNEKFSLQGAVVVMAQQIVDAQLAARYQQANIPIWVYTVDDVERGNKLLAMGVKAIITNRPDLFLA